MLFRRCAVGGQDYSHGGDGENLVPSSRLKEDLLIGTFRHHLQEFLIVLAICNTVVVNSQPHHDTMNSSGVIEKPQRNGEEAGRFVFLSMNSEIRFIDIKQIEEITLVRKVQQKSLSTEIKI